MTALHSSRLSLLAATLGLATLAVPVGGQEPETVKLLDLAGQDHRQVVVDREAGRTWVTPRRCSWKTGAPCSLSTRRGTAGVRS